MFAGILFLIAAVSFALLSFVIYMKNKNSKTLRYLYWARVISTLLLTPYVYFQYVFADSTYLPHLIIFIFTSLGFLYLLVRRWDKSGRLKRK